MKRSCPASSPTRFAGRKPFIGKVTGKAQFAVEQGYIARVEMIVEDPTETLEVYFTRSAPGDDQRKMEAEPRIASPERKVNAEPRR